MLLADSRVTFMRTQLPYTNAVDFLTMVLGQLVRAGPVLLDSTQQDKVVWMLAIIVGDSRRGKYH